MQTSVLGFVLAAAVGAAPVCAAEPLAAGASDVRECLALLHDGRFAEADIRAKQLQERRLGDPSAAFLGAFVAWWQSLYDDKNENLLKTLEERLEVAASAAEAAGPGRSAGVDHLVWNGYSHILLAEVHADRREVFSAARDAKEGRKLLAEALASDATSPEPCFGLGTYNYYADQLSVLAKGVRFLLGMPSGNRETGLRQLEFAADQSAIFGLESRLLLATIYVGRRERDYVSALRELGKTLQPTGSPVVALDAASRLDLALGETDRAIVRLDEALQRASESLPADSTVVAAIRLNRARADFSAFRLELALEQARNLLDSASPLPERVQREARSLVDSCVRLTGRVAAPPIANAKRGDPVNPGLTPELWARIQTALATERTSGAPSTLPGLRSLAQDMAANPTVALFLGRALLASGHASEALLLLERASRSADLPHEWIGPARLYAGQAADLLGERARAVGYYRDATKAPAFVENAAPYFYQRVPYTRTAAPQAPTQSSAR